MSAVATHAVSFAWRWPWAGRPVFGDLRVRYGIKMGLAGVLALFFTQLLRLPNDNWATLTARDGERAVRGSDRLQGSCA
jgi:hypothetical protein